MFKIHSLIDSGVIIQHNWVVDSDTEWSVDFKMQIGIARIFFLYRETGKISTRELAWQGTD